MALKYLFFGFDGNVHAQPQSCECERVCEHHDCSMIPDQVVDFGDAHDDGAHWHKECEGQSHACCVSYYAVASGWVFLHFLSQGCCDWGTVRMVLLVEVGMVDLPSAKMVSRIGEGFMMEVGVDLVYRLKRRP